VVSKNISEIWGGGSVDKHLQEKQTKTIKELNLNPQKAHESHMLVHAYNSSCPLIRCDAETGEPCKLKGQLGWHT